ncbi:MAG: YcaO-like family protein [Siculibacillus sp.]|nr:YcaO-like family protein [Siculibacillus sp.]
MIPAARLASLLASNVAEMEARGFGSAYFDRMRPPDDTVRAMRPKFGEFGITRLARLTGLDDIGIPVWAATRPNARTLAVSQGKGLDDGAARASAVMEAIEVATAERPDRAGVLASTAQLRAAGRRSNRLDVLLRRGVTPPSDDEIFPWIEGLDLVSGEGVFVPLEAAVLHDGRAATRWWQSTDGLASGNVFWEATLHGLSERIERDAMTLWTLRDDAAVAAACLDVAAFEDPELSRLDRVVTEAGFHLRLFDVTSDLGIPVIFAVISPVPNGHEDKWKHFDLTAGSGCHPDPTRAAIRAVTEAAQSRLTTIAAARDDFEPARYSAKLKGDLLAYVRATPCRRASRPPEPFGPRVGWIGAMVSRLVRGGVREVIVVPLETGENDYAVAKVFAPDLENPPGDRARSFGPRAVRAMMGLA